MVDVESLLIFFSSNSIKSHHCVHYLAGNLIFSRKKVGKEGNFKKTLATTYYYYPKKLFYSVHVRSVTLVILEQAVKYLRRVVHQKFHG